MNAIFAILITLAALLLIGVVLIQKSKVLYVGVTDFGGNGLTS